MMSSSRRSAIAVAALAALAVASCSFVEHKPPPLEGKRIPVMIYDSGLKADPDLASVQVVTAPPVENATWTTASGNAHHTLYHLALGPAPRKVWSADAGEEADREERLLAQPVVDKDGRVFTLDVEAHLSAFDVKSGDRLWDRDLRGDEDSDGTLGGGLAVDGGTVYVTTGFAQVLAVDAKTGKVLWRQNVSAPIRSAPTVAEGRVFVVSNDNQTQALDAKTGSIVWTHRGATELASLLGGASPAYDAGVLVVAYSTGELFGLRASNGTELWSDYLSRAARSSAVGQIADIRASPVIDRGRVIAISNSGRMVAINLANGQRIWEQQIAGIQTPWVAGDYIYVLTTDSTLVCLTRADGRIRWVRSMPRYKDPKDREELITWSGPVLAGDRLLIAGTNQDVLSISPYSGDLLGEVHMSDPVSIAPVVARDTLFIFTDGADLIAYR